MTNEDAWARRPRASTLVSGGATDVALSGDEQRAEVTVRWPSDEHLAFANIAREEVASFLRIFAPIAARLGLRYDQMQEGDRTKITFSR